jgi:RHS repeat-associated protein
VTGAATSNPLAYTGRENDGTGLYYYRARYYLTGLGRFVSEDPIGLEGGYNTYAYVGGNPVSFVDPLGLRETRFPGQNPSHIPDDDPATPRPPFPHRPAVAQSYVRQDARRPPGTASGTVPTRVGGLPFMPSGLARSRGAIGCGSAK